MGERLNVLLVAIDGARADHLGCYGHTRETTPFLDGLARDGVRFSAAFTTAPWSLPAHASLFTGLFTTTHGASHEHPYLAAAPTTVAEVLHGAGYRTSAFCSDPWINPAHGFGRGFDDFHTLLGDGSIGRAAFYARRATDRLLRRADAGARRANLAFFDWVGGGDEPFFAFLHYGEPRLKRHPPASYERMFLSPDVRRGQLRAVERAWTREQLAGEEGGEDPRRILTGIYEGALRYVDVRLEEVARHLESRGLWDRTLVLVTADHGQDLGEHPAGSATRGLHDTVLRVPLLLRCPPQVPQGFVVDEIAQHVDIAPTILEAVGLEAPAPMQGRALLRQGRVTAGPEFAVAERFRPDLQFLRKRNADADLQRFDVRERVLRTRREKFIWRSDERNEFYDLVTDPMEQHNRVDEARARVAALRARLFDWLASLERHAPDEHTAAEEAARQHA